MKYLAHEDFVPHAPDSPGMVRVNHQSVTCQGDSDSLRIVREEDGSIHAKCFRCGASGRYAVGVSKYAAYARQLNARTPQSMRVQQVYMPHDSTLVIGDMPALVRSKLHAYGITQADMNLYGVAWSEYHNRMIFPVTRGGHLVGWQGRSWEKDVPKYITRYKDLSDLFAYYPTEVLGEGENVCVIVEDAFSAIRCAKYCNVLAMLGSDVGDKALNTILEGNTRFLIFNDWDNRIIKMKAHDILRRLKMVGAKASIISNVKGDPKEQTNEMLKAVLTQTN